MEINTDDVRNGKIAGKIVWVCDFRFNDYGQKAVRHVQPTRVQVRRNSATTTRVYYSDCHFVKFKNNGELEKNKIIQLYDNTGFRSRTGTPLRVFEYESECKIFYNKRLEIIARELEQYKRQSIANIDIRISKVNELYQDVDMSIANSQNIAEDFKSHSYEVMSKFLLENGWEQSWDEDNWVKSDSLYKEANTGRSTLQAYLSAKGVTDKIYKFK